MGTEILKSFGTLQSELEQARNGLRFVDESIKRLIGRDPSELARPALKRGPPAVDVRHRGPASRVPQQQRSHENDEGQPPSAKRRLGGVFRRLSERPAVTQQQQHYFEEEVEQQPQRLISKVIVTPKEVPSRQEALAAQNVDEKAKARNRRMFGALLGTLQKFQQEETKMKQKEEMRAQLEKKIEEHEIKEKAEIKKERQELFLNRKKRQAEIKMIELKMMRMKEYAIWEERQKPRMNFIQTKTKPHICYLPRKLNDTSKELLENCKKDIEKMIDKKRQEVFAELQHIEERMKRNFEPRKNKEETSEKEATESGENDKMETETEAPQDESHTIMEETNGSREKPEDDTEENNEVKSEKIETGGAPTEASDKTQTETESVIENEKTSEDKETERMEDQ